MSRLEIRVKKKMLKALRAKDVSYTKNEQDIQIEAGGAGTEVGRTDDPLTQ
jgi:hypothetical protein